MDDVLVGLPESLGVWLGDCVGVADALDSDAEAELLDSEGVGDSLDSEGVAEDGSGLESDDCGDWGDWLLDWDCWSVGTGGCGESGGVFWKISTTISKASAVNTNINSQETVIVIQPARSLRAGHCNGHSRQRPGRVSSTQCNR